FCQDFVAALRHILIVFKQEAAVERLIDFIARFATETVGDYENDDDQTAIQERSNQFMIFLLQFLLSINQAQDRGIRYRSCQLVCKLLNNLSEDAQIDDDLYNLIYEAMLERLYDKVPAVRIQAVRAVARLQDPTDEDCIVIKKYIELISKDSSAEVRRAVLANIAINALTLPEIIERTKDIKESVRRVAYQVLAERVGIKSLTINQRLDLLENGLKDRSKGIQLICKGKLLTNWLVSLGSNVLVLLQHLDVENATKTIQSVLNMLFMDIPLEDLIAPLVSNDANVVVYGRAKVPKEDSVTSEIVLYWRCLTQHLNSIENHGEEYLDKILPELSVFCEYIKRFIALPYDKQDEESTITRAFILEQLLMLAGVMDLTDEVGRKNFRKLLKEQMMALNSLPTLLPVVMEQYQKLSPDCKNYVSEITEVISDIRQPLVSTRLKYSKEEIRQMELKIARLRVKINELKEKLEECVAEEDFSSAGEIKSSIQELEEQKSQLKDDCEATEFETVIAQDENEVVYRCLSIFKEMLANVTEISTSVHPIINDLMDSLILPSVQNEDPVIRKVAVECLSVCSIINKERARIQLILFLQIMQVDQLEVRLVALKAVFDLLHVFGFKICSESDTEQTSDGNQQNGDENNLNTSSKLLAILTSFLDNELGEIRQVAAEGFAKLLLSGRLSSPKLISRLLLLWYSPTSEDDLHLRHCLGVFFQAFALNSNENQQCLLDAFFPTLHTIADAPDDSALRDIDANNVAELVTHLTSLHIFQANQEHQKEKRTIENLVNVHDDLAVKICNEILSDHEGPLLRVWCKMLNSLSIDKLNSPNVKILTDLVLEALEVVNDKICLKALQKFKQCLLSNNTDENQENTEEGAD
ncbi:uncharacterized protein TRIADDRAFT_32599, partial [Trichoplax adhaerens]